MARIDLPGGGWADILDLKGAKERDRRRFKAAVVKASRLATVADSERFVDATYEMLVAGIREWSFGPITIDALLDLDPPDYEAIDKAVTVSARRFLKGTQFGPPDEGEPAEDSPFGPLNGSARSPSEASLPTT